MMEEPDVKQSVESLIAVYNLLPDFIFNFHSHVFIVGKQCKPPVFLLRIPADREPSVAVI